MHKHKTGFSIFVVSLLISFVILGSIFLIFLLYTKTYGVDKNQSDIPYTSDYAPRPDESMSLLLLGCEEAQSLPELSVIFYYDAPNSIIYTITIPSVTLCNADGKTSTIQGHYDYAGIRGSVNGAKSLFNADIDRYVRIQAIGISNITDFLKGLPYDIKEDVTIGTQTIKKGSQLLDGRRFSLLMFYKQNELTTDCVLQSSLISKLLTQSFKSNLSEQYDDLVSTIFYNTETNLNQYDFAKRKTGFTGNLKQDNVEIKEIAVNGSYNSDYTEFTANKEDVSKIGQLLNGEGYAE